VRRPRADLPPSLHAGPTRGSGVTAYVHDCSTKTAVGTALAGDRQHLAMTATITLGARVRCVYLRAVRNLCAGCSYHCHSRTVSALMLQSGPLIREQRLSNACMLRCRSRRPVAGSSQPLTGETRPLPAGPRTARTYPSQPQALAEA